MTEPQKTPEQAEDTPAETQTSVETPSQQTSIQQDVATIPAASESSHQKAPHVSAPEPQQPNSMPVTPQPNMLDMRELRSAQTFTMVGTIAGPVSLFIGGVLLSLIGLVCGCIGRKKYLALEAKGTEVSDWARRMKKSAKVAIIVSAVAFVLNAVSLFLMWPMLMQLMQSGDVAGIAQNAGTVAGAGSTWG